MIIFYDLGTIYDDVVHSFQLYRNTKICQENGYDGEAEGKLK